MQCPFGEGWCWAGALSLLFQRGRTTCLLGLLAALALCSRQVGPPVFAQMQAIAVLKQMLCDLKKLWVFVGYSGFLWVFWQSKASRIWFAQKTVECGFAPK